MKTHKATTLAVALMALVLMLAVAAPAFAGDGVGEVQASVEMDQYCVNLELGSDLSFGTAGVGEAAEEVNDHAIIVRNSGTGAAQIMVQGTDATGPGGATWALADEAGWGSFAWYFVNSSPEADGTPVYVSKDARVLVPSLAYQETVALNAKLMTPTCSTIPGVFTWSATIYAVPTED